MGALSNITSFWTGLTGPGRRLIIGAGVIFAVGLFMLMRLSGSVDYSTLATADTVADAAAITKELESQGIAYRTRDGGTTIQVPSGSLDKARLGLASSNVGVGSGGLIGYEIFDKQGWGATDFTQRVNLLRARQGDLSRTIAQYDQVRSATVKLAMPEQRLFENASSDTTASVLLSLVPGAVLEPEQVSAITRLVAMAVPGLKPANVTISDTQGNLLSSSDDGGASNAGVRMELESAVAREKQAKLDALLAQQLGPGLAATQVDVTLDLDNVSSKSEIYGKDKNPPKLDTDTSRETVTQTGSGTTGVAGASANSPGNTFPTTTGSTGTTDYRKNTDRTRNGVDRTITNRVGVAGTIVRQSVSVQVDNKYTGDVAALEDAIKAAVGFDQTTRRCGQRPEGGVR
ncbi:MAG: flagellar basal-body MS-ring/collar protein FliF [Thermoleophilia bacterium]